LEIERLEIERLEIERLEIEEVVGIAESHNLPISNLYSPISRQQI